MFMIRIMAKGEKSNKALPYSLVSKSMFGIVGADGDPLLSKAEV